MSGPRAAVEDEAGVRLISFNRPEARNAFDAPMYAAVTEALVGAVDDDGVAVVVLTGRGKAFTAGQDLREMAALATGSSGTTGFPGLLDALVALDKPLLAAVHGVGVGLGCTILGHVDITLIEEGARLRTPFAEMGVPPEAASSWLLPERMGWQRAASLLLASEWIDAGQAVEAGLALRVCLPGTVVDETMTLARRIAGFPPHATREIKRLMTAARRDPVAAARRREDAAFAALFADPAHNPGQALVAGLDR
jgi:enoyl-CoA hydratase/carnithine racemase